MSRDPAPWARSAIQRVYDETRDVYGPAIGLDRSQLVTPALVLDLPAAQRNIARMASAIRDIGSTIRPHIKVHKSPELARLQVEAGAIGLSVATVWEAVVLADAGLDHLFLVNTVAGAQKIRTVAELARGVDLMVAVDDAANARALSAAAKMAGSILGVAIEVDTGMDRGGVDTPGAALALARAVSELDGLSLRGITGYEGHCALTPERELRHARERTAMTMFIEVAEALERDGLLCPIRSAGGTATWDWTAAFPGVTEIQAGTYVVMDNFHARMISGFEHSLTVQATVVSQPPGRIIVDAGSKSVGDGEMAAIVGHPELPFRFDEEHGIFAAPSPTGLKVGDAVALVPGYSPSTVNAYDAIHIVQDERVVDVWPVIPRGPGHHGLSVGPTDRGRALDGDRAMDAGGAVT
jgi:D-serine deaminase-like pyridoxal phosphate-dependent protein